MRRLQPAFQPFAAAAPFWSGGGQLAQPIAYLVAFVIFFGGKFTGRAEHLLEGCVAIRPNIDLDGPVNVDKQASQCNPNFA